WDGDNSQIHNTMISVGLWFTEGLAGIRPDERAPGFKHFVAAPGVESGLKRVDASLVTGYGKISSAWRVDGDALTWRLVVPPNTTASVVLPATGFDAVLEGGKPAAGQPGITRAGFEKGLFRAEVASGEYRFASRLAYNLDTPSQ
ncbi:MAG TPA: alpha-L-rhamnosidase C-terminal domain-containing protein, partial [Kiritimatiellia bacterium]|nr:alpha-L-rhamnosidase C-terminal domain-containing protein [Kiritimatiellia bacterium]